MEIVIQATYFIMSLSFLIILHELGHFIPARLFKTRVEKFFLFFDAGAKLFSFKKGDTEYGIGWLPLGGYVKISGMIDESMDKDQMASEPQPWEFRSKPAWQRLIIMLGGVIVNAVLAVIIFSGVLFTYGEEKLPNQSVQYGVTPDSLGAMIGIQEGDKIAKIDGEEVKYFTDITGTVVLNKAQSITVDRNGEMIDLEVKGTDIKAIIERGGIPFITPRIPLVLKEVAKDGPAKAAGLLATDKPLTINGESVTYVHDMIEVVSSHKNEMIELVALRGMDTVSFEMQVTDKGTIGIVMDTDLQNFFKIEKYQYSFGEAIVGGFNKTIEKLEGYVGQFDLVFDSEIQGYKQMGGFISMGKIFPSVWGDWESFWVMTAILSIVLAFMNLLPIPALDGGHVLFTLVEIISGRKPSVKFLEKAQTVGMILLLALMVYVNANDVVKLF